jgi:hypothetical protein
MLNTERLMSSELAALYGNEIIGAALMLWCRARKQRPAASLPDDDKVNSAFARLPLARFRKLKTGSCTASSNAAMAVSITLFSPLKRRRPTRKRSRFRSGARPTPNGSTIGAKGNLIRVATRWACSLKAMQKRWMKRVSTRVSSLTETGRTGTGTDT